MAPTPDPGSHGGALTDSFRLAARRRGKLIEETRQSPDPELEPRDELSEDSVSKSVDDLLK